MNIVSNFTFNNIKPKYQNRVHDAIKQFYLFSSNKISNNFRISFNGYDTYEGMSAEEKALLRKQRKQKEKAEKQKRYEQSLERKEREKPISTIDEVNKTLDIVAKGMYPANVLSNYKREEVPFFVDDIPCHSIEGFLQSLKTPDINLQRELCLKSGSSARHLGRMLTKDSWKKSQILYWKGVPIARNSSEYMKLVKRAYTSRFEHSEEFRKALGDSRGYALLHTCGNNNQMDTVLTQDEFINILNSLRDEL